MVRVTRARALWRACFVTGSETAQRMTCGWHSCAEQLVATSTMADGNPFGAPSPAYGGSSVGSNPFDPMAAPSSPVGGHDPFSTAPPPPPAQGPPSMPPPPGSDNPFGATMSSPSSASMASQPYGAPPGSQMAPYGSAYPYAISPTASYQSGPSQETALVPSHNVNPYAGLLAPAPAQPNQPYGGGAPSSGGGGVFDPFAPPPPMPPAPAPPVPQPAYTSPPQPQTDLGPYGGSMHSTQADLGPFGEPLPSPQDDLGPFGEERKPPAVESPVRSSGYRNNEGSSSYRGPDEPTPPPRLASVPNQAYEFGQREDPTATIDRDEPVRDPVRNPYREELARRAPPGASPLPKAELVRKRGYVLSRISFRTIVMKKWKQTYWVQYGPHTMLWFRSEADFEDWLNNPYHDQAARNFLIKLAVNFVHDLYKPNVRGYQVTQCRTKAYGNKMIRQFKLERWMDYGPTIAAAFGSYNPKEVDDLREALVECMRNTPLNSGIRATGAVRQQQEERSRGEFYETSSCMLDVPFAVSISRLLLLPPLSQTTTMMMTTMIIVVSIAMTIALTQQVTTGRRQERTEGMYLHLVILSQKKLICWMSTTGTTCLSNSHRHSRNTQ